MLTKMLNSRSSCARDQSLLITLQKANKKGPHWYVNNRKMIYGSIRSFLSWQSIILTDIKHGLLFFVPAILSNRHKNTTSGAGYLRQTIQKIGCIFYVGRLK
jgi:hypothetical protein